MTKELKTLLPLVRKHWWRYALGLVFLVGIDYAQTEIPQFIKRIVDSIATLEAGGNALLFPILFTMVLTAFFIASGRFLWRFFIHGASRRIERDFRGKLFSHLMTLPMKSFQETPVGELMARATNDMQSIRMLTGMAIVTFIDGFFMSSLVLFRMFRENAGIALKVIIPLPIITVIILFFGASIGKRFKKIQEVYGSMSTLVQETLQGIRIVKAFVKKETFPERFNLDGKRTLLTPVT